MGYRLGIDTGGTFTDIALLDEKSGSFFVDKVPSTPHNPSEAVINGIHRILKKRGIDEKDIAYFIHGSTVATNALLEKKGAKTALITTKGFQDVLEIGRQSRPKLYDIRARNPEPLVSRQYRFEVDERVLFSGEVLTSLQEEQVRDIGIKMQNEGIEAVAVCLMNSYVNDTHEKMIKEILEEFTGFYVTISSEVLPEYKEYERTSTIVSNAYVMPKMQGYIKHLEDSLEEMEIPSELYVMQSNGGIIKAETAREVPVRTLLSGPAGGSVTGTLLTEMTQFENIITIDMGGTSLDTSLIKDGKAQHTTLSKVGEYPIKMPMVDMHTIGSGGGSLAWIDSGGALRVGPESASSNPGPVCYNLGGTELTVTDANVILGRLNPKYLLGGEMEINLDKARKLMEEKIAQPLGMSIEEAAIGILKVVNANIVRGIRVISLEKGHDPRDFSLVAFGGAGPGHAVDLGMEIGSKQVIIPRHPGVACAVGMLTADVRHDYVRTMVTTIAALDLNTLKAAVDDLWTESVDQLQHEGFSLDENIILQGYLDLRYIHQAYEISVPVDINNIGMKNIEDSIVRFHQMHESMYGFSREEEEVELVNIRLVATGKFEKVNFEGESNFSKGQAEAESDEKRKVFFDDQFISTPVYKRESLLEGEMIIGPAIIEQLDSTIVIYPLQEAALDAFGNLIIHLNNENEGVL
ncbi:hydantoinase/oxoprolinase family protein [Virgibacillus oceani]